MSSEKQIAANRANAQHSSGPRSETGKAASSMNNFRHGLADAWMILEWEDHADDRAFHKALNDLLKLRAETRKQQIGFDSQKRRAAGENPQASARKSPAGTTQIRYFARRRQG